MLTYKAALQKLGKRKSIKLENNTYLFRVLDTNMLAIRIHGSPIVTLRPDKTLELRTGGYRTRVVKNRIKKYSGLDIFQEKGVWYIGDIVNYSVRLRFSEGMVVETF